MDEHKKVKIPEVKVSLAKAEHYSAYKELAQQEVRDKLYEWGIWPDAIEKIISELIGATILTDERFAKAYARGKINQNGWGKNKIKQGLKFKKVTDVLIKKALLAISDDDYLQALEIILTKKARTLNEKDPLKRRFKLQAYALGRGFELDLILDILKTSDL